MTARAVVAAGLGAGMLLLVAGCAESTSRRPDEGALSAEEVARARGVPSNASAYIELEAVGAYLGTVTLAVEPDDRARILLTGTSRMGSGFSGAIALPDRFTVSRRGSRFHHTPSPGGAWLLDNAGSMHTSSDQRAETSWLMREIDFRMDATGAFALEAQAVEYSGVSFERPAEVPTEHRLSASGRIVGECMVALTDGTIVQDARLAARPRCRELLSQF